MARFFIRSVLVAAVAMGTARLAEAQVAVTGNVAGNNAGNVNGGNFLGGIAIDAQGVVRPVFKKDESGDLARKRREAASDVPSDLKRASPLRKVSLVRLEEAIRPYAEKREDLTPAMNYLAGLQRIDYVFVYPESKDLVIAGPAEGFAPDGAGRMTGLKSGRPPLRLDDLMVVLRAVERGGMIGCSIDPNPQRNAELQKFLKENPATGGRDAAIALYKEMARILGNQDVRVLGVPGETHVAQTLVEADYRMKLIALGLEEIPVRGFRSHLMAAPPRARSVQRWWLAPLYDAFRSTPDGNAYEFRGQRVQLMSAEELTDLSGKRTDAATTRISTQKWAQLFTEKYPEIAEHATVFAELQNIFDMAILAALMKKERLPQKVDWSQSLFLDASKATVATGHAPRQVPTVFNWRAAGQGVTTGMIGGGVSMNPVQALRGASITRDDSGKLGTHRKDAESTKRSDDHPWWWD